MYNLISSDAGWYMLRQKYSRGFTLIELIVVVSIMTLFMGVSIANYNSFTTEKKFDAEVKRVVDVLELAKSKAHAGDVGAFSCDDFNGYQVALSGSTYFLRMCCDNTCTNFNTVATYRIPVGISASFASGSSIQFYPLTTGVSVSSSNTITVNSTVLNKCAPINISNNGLIEEGAKVSC